MERCSYFIKDKALFGSYPTQEAVRTLEENNVRCFVDLTDFNERKTTPYVTKYKYIKYPISDRKIPINWKTFAQLILQICNEIRKLDDKNKIYIHCKGGHGRSGIVVACVLCQFCGMSPDDALRITTRCHSRRKEMREKWRKIGSPQSNTQKDFVRRFFRPLKYSNMRYSKYTMGMDNHGDYPVDLGGMGKFPTAHLAFQSYRDPDNQKYIHNLKQGNIDASLISRQHHNWEENKVEYMYAILKNKFNQHTMLKENLINTGLRPLVKCSKDGFWGEGGNGQGKNMHGRLLAKLRVDFLVGMV